MDFLDWLAWAFWVVVFSRMFIHFSRVDRKMENEGRVFGTSWFRILGVLMLPWAIRKAEREYLEQENNRNSGK